MSDDVETDTHTQDAQPAPWTVKGMPRERRDAINAAAKRADMTVAAFIWDACEARIRDDRLPIGAVATMPSTALVRHPGDDLHPGSRASSPVDDLQKLTQMAVLISAAGLENTDALKSVKRAVAARAARLIDG